MEQLEHIVGKESPQWLLLLNATPDITYLSKPNSRLVLTPSTMKECEGVLSRLMSLTAAEKL